MSDTAPKKASGSVECEFDLALIKLTAPAYSGDIEPLAKHIETGGNLDGQTRKFLAAFLRGEIKYSRRKFSQRMKELQVVFEVRNLQKYYAGVNGSRGSRNRAIVHYLESHDEMKEDTLKDYLKRNGGTLSKSHLALIDEIRAEILGVGNTP